MSACRFKAVVYCDAKGEFRWRIKAKNGRILVASSEGFKRRESCLRNLERTSEAFLDYELTFTNVPPSNPPRASKKRSYRKKTNLKLVHGGG